MSIVKNIRSTLVIILSGANLATIVVMLLVGYAGYINPTAHSYLSTLTIFFPVVLLFNIAFLIVWLLVKPSRAVIPVAGLLLVFVPIRTYAPLNIHRADGERMLTVISFNTYRFGSNHKSMDSIDAVVKYLNEGGADIICLQEMTTKHFDYVRAKLAARFPFCDTINGRMPDCCVAVMSRRPLIGKEHINYTGDMNESMACRAIVDGDTFLVVNNYLRSNEITNDDKVAFRSMVTGTLPGDNIHDETERLYIKLAVANRERAAQADSVARYIAAHRSAPLIVCGDLNSDPLSYTHHTVARSLTDCYVAAGNGPGWTYQRNGMFFRIDHIFCSKQLKPVSCRVDKSIGISDHYPLVCRLDYSGALKTAHTVR